MSYIPSMREGLTVKGIAERLQPDPELRPAMIRRLRHWTRHDLLLPFGEKHSGTGRWRTYRDEAVYVAAVLNELANNDLPVPLLKAIATNLWLHLGIPRVLPLPEPGEVAMAEAKSGGRAVYLNVGRSLPSQSGFAIIDYTAFPDNLPDGVASATVVNLTKVFEQLR